MMHIILFYDAEWWCTRTQQPSCWSVIHETENRQVSDVWAELTDLQGDGAPQITDSKIVPHIWTCNLCPGIWILTSGMCSWSLRVRGTLCIRCPATTNITVISCWRRDPLLTDKLFKMCSQHYCLIYRSFHKLYKCVSCCWGIFYDFFFLNGQYVIFRYFDTNMDIVISLKNPVCIRLIFSISASWKLRFPLFTSAHKKRGSCFFHTQINSAFMVSYMYYRKAEVRISSISVSYTKEQK